MEIRKYIQNSYYLKKGKPLMFVLSVDDSFIDEVWPIIIYVLERECICFKKRRNMKFSIFTPHANHIFTKLKNMKRDEVELSSKLSILNRD